MTAWFVSTTRSVPGGVEWLLSACATEEEAKSVAAKALARALRVEAGTVPGIEPRVRIGARTAHQWAQSSSENAIMGLRRRLATFAA